MYLHRGCSKIGSCVLRCMFVQGTSKLLLNANLWPEMTCAKMEERGVTFACVNHVGEDPSTQLSTYAVRMKDAAKANEFMTAVGNFKSGGEALNSVEKGLSKRSTQGGVEVLAHQRHIFKFVSL